MFGLSVATELFQGSTERTWNCVLHLVHLIWTKLNHIRQPRMPRTRKRHHSRSRSKSRSPSRERSHERDEKHKKNDSRDKDRDGKRRKIESYESPLHKRSVSSTPEPQDTENCPVQSLDQAEVKDTVEVNDESDAGAKSPVDDKKACNDVVSPPKENTFQSTKASKETQLSQNVVVEIEKMETSEVDNEGQSSQEDGVILDDSDEPSKEGSTAFDKSNLEITPNKGMTPKRVQKKLESEKKRQQRQKEKEEKEKKKQEEKERVRQEKLKKKEEKQKEVEQKQKEKELKEEQKKKEKEEKEELKRKEREEKEQKRKEKEEKEEQKRKEREQEKLKKQHEIEEKNKEKQKEEELKQKTAAAFVNFFVPKKSDGLQEEKKAKVVAQTLAFMEFEVKSDMKLPPPRRKLLSETEKKVLERYIENPDETQSYIKDLKSGKRIGKSGKTWPFEESVDDDVTIIEDDGNLGETICEDQSKLQKFRAKFLKFHENRRPAYFGTWRKNTSQIKPRKPFGTDCEIFNYEEDSDDDWEEEEQGESLNGSDDEADKENEDENDYEVDNEFFVPHGHLSDDEIDDEESSKLSPESLKQKLKLLKDEFDEDMQSKTHKLKPRSIGCIWYNKDGSNVEEAIRRYLQPLAMITNGQIQIKKRSEIFSQNSGKKTKPLKEMNPEHIPLFLKVIHGNSSKKHLLIEQFMTYMANNGFTVDISKATLLKNLKRLATWRKCTDNGPLKNKFCWLANEDVVQKYNVSLGSSNGTESDRK